jgi:hypothetical protein
MCEECASIRTKPSAPGTSHQVATLSNRDRAFKPASKVDHASTPLLVPTSSVYLDSGQDWDTHTFIAIRARPPACCSATSRC